MSNSSRSPKNLLEGLATATKSGEILNQEFYSDSNLRSHLGDHLNIRPSKGSSPDRIEINFDDFGYQYPPLGTESDKRNTDIPFIQSGLAWLEENARSRKKIATIALATMERAARARDFNASLVIDLFGSPESTAVGTPSMPPRGIRGHRLQMKTHELGNLWINYKLRNPKSLADLRLRTFGDSIIAEVHLTVREK